jgi:alkylation response protein AidB-like acyl-CoA dehydrogenase
MRVWRERQLHDPARRDRLMQAWVATQVVGWLVDRAGQQRRMGVPGHEGSLIKVAMTELNQLVSDLTVDLMGSEGMLLPHQYFDGRYQQQSEAPSIDPRMRFLRARANTIEGGTSEAQRNNLGDHVLGLPGEPRADKALAWNQVPRST